MELDEERRRHAETTKIMRKKERQVKEIMIQGEEDHKNVALLQDSVEKLTQKLNVYKRQLQEQVGLNIPVDNPKWLIRQIHILIPFSFFQIGGHVTAKSEPSPTVPARIGGRRGSG